MKLIGASDGDYEDVISSFIIEDEYYEEVSIWKNESVSLQFSAQETNYSISDIYSECAFDDPEQEEI